MHKETCESTNFKIIKWFTKQSVDKVFDTEILLRVIYILSKPYKASNHFKENKSLRS